MSDIVERLRAWSPLIASGMEVPAASLTAEEAADEITRLRAEVLEQARLLGMSGEREAKLLARVEELTDALIDARHNGLIYWNPMTTRGAVGRAAMMARIDKVLNK